MKKLFPVVLILLVGGSIWYFTRSDQGLVQGGANSVAKSGSTAAGGQGGAAPGSGGPTGDASVDRAESSADESEADEDVKPAVEVYTSADQALEAVKKAALDYDDLVLEQFTEVSENCTWCPDFYKNLKEMMVAPDATDDQKSYYAELLAVSGRVENVSALLDSIKGAPNQEAADLYAEALEVTVGNDKVVSFLGDQLNSENQQLKESVVAAVTNHGSRLAVETLYKHTVEAGDPDGYYSLGIGLGEVIPDDDSMPYLTELVNKRDAYSHLALKALLNGGNQGLRTVMDILSNSKDNDFDRQMLRDAVDHVNFEEENEKYLRKLAETSQQPVVVEFAKQILADYDLDDKDGETAEGGETP